MRKPAPLKLVIVIISIIALFFLIGHTHHDFYELGDDSHCPLCHILSAGFTIVIIFALPLLAIITPFILNRAQPRTAGRRHFRFNLRAPPAFTTLIRTNFRLCSPFFLRNGKIFKMPLYPFSLRKKLQSAA